MIEDKSFHSFFSLWCSLLDNEIHHWSLHFSEEVGKFERLQKKTENALCLENKELGRKA